MNDQAFAFTAEQQSEILRTALTVEAAQKSLPIEQQESLDQIIERVGFLMSPGSISVSNTLNRVEKRFRRKDGSSKIKQWKQISGTLIHVDREVTSGRALLVIATPPSQEYPVGQETVRTNSTEWDDLAKSMAKRAVQHIGERVLMRVAVEHTENKTRPTARVLHDIVFFGPDPKMYDPNGVLNLPQVRWDALGNQNGPFDTSRLATFQQR